MIEVFKTDVNDEFTALWLLDSLHANFAHWKANFDLDDSDHILRVVPLKGEVCVITVVAWLAKHGYWAEQLPD